MSLRDIKRRIRSVKLTKKITKAIQMVAASKVKHAQLKALATRAYREQLLTMMQSTGMNASSMLSKDSQDHVLYIYFSSDRGLCGSYNSLMQKFFFKGAIDHRKHSTVVTIGRKGLKALKAMGFSVAASFVGFSDKPRLVDILPVVHTVMELLQQKQITRVVLAYQHFVNPAVQKPSLRTLLPILAGGHAHQDEEDLDADYFEPNKQKISQELLPHYLQVMMYQTLLEANASEQYARMMAMEQASSNASDLIADLTQSYNKLRQSAITTELAEIVSGRGKN